MSFRGRLRQLERDDLSDLDDDLLGVYHLLEREGIELLISGSERGIRSTDASEPPKLISMFMFSDIPAIIALPKNHLEVKRCVRICRRHGVPLVVRGAASSAFGAVLPPDEGIVLDMGELVGVSSIDREDMIAEMMAGTRWADLSLELEKIGLALRTSPSSFFSTVGGWISTGGLGINSLSSGAVSDHIQRIRVVFPDGSDAYLTRDDPRFDLFIGTEGQMGVITEVSLSVRSAPGQSRTILLQVSDDERALHLISSILKNGDKIAHMMFFDENRTKEINQITSIPGKPLHDTPAILLLIESDGEKPLELTLPQDIGWGESPSFMARLLWGDRYFPMRGRKRGPGMLGAEMIIPLQLMHKYLGRIRKLGLLFGVEIASEAHILSEKEALVISFFTTDQRRSLMYTVHSLLSMLITRIGIEFKGRPYAVGIWNLPFSSFVIHPDRLEELRRQRQKLDPDDQFNPGRFLSSRSKFSAPLRMFLKERTTLFALGALLAAAEFLGRLSRGIRSKGIEEDLSPLELSTYACARCGACVTVCPAYIATGRETVTGRGKLLFARQILRGWLPGDAEAKELFLCMKCHACEEVCQTRLPLLAAYEELEEIVESEMGRPKSLIESFVAEVESSPEYEKMLYEGIISPDAGAKEGESDAI